MWKRHKSEPQRLPEKDTLIIIGNGFDIWQGLHTSYEEFQAYYLAHRDAILRKLRIRKKTFLDEEGQRISVSDVELIYGDPFRPQELDKSFWSTFEASLDQLDAERINLFFGKDRWGLREMKKSIRNANRILREAFCSWIATIGIDQREATHSFGDNCFFINFNYTDTLPKRFAVPETDEYHIHGEAGEKDSIIFGHASHPQLPEPMLYRLGGRFRGLYLVEQVLYETDKHVQDNIAELAMTLALHGVSAERIKQVYVLGHSMGPADLEYFDFLIRATQVGEPAEGTQPAVDDSKERNAMEELHLRMQYAIQHGGYGEEDSAIDSECLDAITRRYEQEQKARSQEYDKMFRKMLFGRSWSVEDKERTAQDAPCRTEDATWHISYYSPSDREWAEKVMMTFGCKQFRLYPSIDKCLESFRVSNPV